MSRLINNNECPANFNLSVIKPVPKTGPKDLGDISNYRPIALSDALPNILELYLLEEFNRQYRLTWTSSSASSAIAHTHTPSSPPRKP